MSKIIDATCSAAGIVTAEGVPIPTAQVLSEGKQTSSGLLFIDGDKARYMPSSASDIKSLITKLVTILTGLDGATNSPGAQATLISELSAFKELLK